MLVFALSLWCCSVLCSTAPTTCVSPQCSRNLSTILSHGSRCTYTAACTHTHGDMHWPLTLTHTHKHTHRGSQGPHQARALTLYDNTWIMTVPGLDLDWLAPYQTQVCWATLPYGEIISHILIISGNAPPHSPPQPREVEPWQQLLTTLSDGHQSGESPEKPQL